ncbi:MAG: ABC transporter substrate-binding protein [Rhodospirillum sp.]|nr:ABC transporter substrate-binding protein [Rhodospirillum sp.]MCF8489067.1 ABC transporter substrate-binding protein [Rhodospirillum sp.]MCF8501230.1 ABC transporter substrate-binding protein [Rhodospirillum sp.]
MYFAKRVIASLMALGLMFGAANPSFAMELPSNPSAFVQELSRLAIDGILKAEVSPEEKVARFDDLLNSAFDLDFISRFVVGGYWKKATEAEQTEFQSLFRDLNVINWGSRFNEYGGQKINVTNTSSRETRGGTIHEVTTNIGKEGEKPLQVIWVLRDNNGKLGVIDLKVEGVSLALTFQSEYKAVLKNTGSMTGLNDVLKAKIEDLRAKQG